jgi:hypothetical protein
VHWKGFALAVSGLEPASKEHVIEKANALSPFFENPGNNLRVPLAGERGKLQERAFSPLPGRVS